MDPERFVFIDETGGSTNMIRRYGWAPRSERLIAAAPHGHWRTTTLVAGLRSSGLIAPLVLDGPMKTKAPVDADERLPVSAVPSFNATAKSATRLGCVCAVTGRSSITLVKSRL